MELTEHEVEIYGVYPLCQERRAEGVKASTAAFGCPWKNWRAPWEVYEASGVYPLLFSLCNISLSFFSSSSLLVLMEYRSSDE